VDQVGLHWAAGAGSVSVMSNTTELSYSQGATHDFMHVEFTEEAVLPNMSMRGRMPAQVRYQSQTMELSSRQRETQNNS